MNLNTIILALVHKAKKFNQQVVLSRNPGKYILIKAHKTLLLILKISFSSKMNPQNNSLIKRRYHRDHSFIYKGKTLDGQNLHLWGTQFNQLPNWVGMGGNKKTTTTRGIKLILVPI
jgi:hypothetical protein